MAYCQLQKVETNMHVKASAEQFYDVYCKRTYHIPNICPEKIKSIEIHEGEWGSEGSIVSWNYIHEGKSCVAKVVVEGIDDENKKVNFKVIEGELLQHYKSFKFVMQFTPKEKGSVVHLVMEYEKQNNEVPDPHDLLQNLVEPVLRKVDAYTY
ncbi:hypothetical protein VNO78_12351 [Psophocarpus tetragonolobus]|uniref:Bet v I/Major latex protein domain-containing protein n=1 Tax=Psophocarpus tetragonolobus TaxID=3891 RepID=A0AAN9SMV2_PSOTE